MVYNAMKLFMEVNPQLFDDCSHEYAEQQNQAEQKQKTRQEKWEKLAQLAKTRENGRIPSTASITSSAGNTSANGSKATTPMRVDDSDPLSQDSSRRLEALRLQDDAQAQRRDRPQASVC
jgi:serine/threonine-protein phosphatase 2A regulatory subunit B'